MPNVPGIVKETGVFPQGVDLQMKRANEIQDVDTNNVFPVVAFVATGLVLLFLLNQYYKSRSKPKKRRPRLKKFHQLFTGKVPSV